MSDIIMIDDEVVGFWGEMLQSLTDMGGDVQIVAEHLKVKNLSEMPQEYEKEGYRHFKPDKLYIGRVTDLL